MVSVAEECAFVTLGGRAQIVTLPKAVPKTVLALAFARTDSASAHLGSLASTAEQLKAALAIVITTVSARTADAPVPLATVATTVPLACLAPATAAVGVSAKTDGAIVILDSVVLPAVKGRFVLRIAATMVCVFTGSASAFPATAAVPVQQD